MTSDRPEVALKPFVWEHVERTFHWILDGELRRQFLVRGEPTWERHQAYFGRVLADPTQRVFAILAGERHVGNCGLKHLSSRDRSAEVWIYVGEAPQRGRGIGRAATELLLHEGFDTLGLSAIYLHVADFNARARKMYERLGFVEVPLLDEAGEWAGHGCRIVRMQLRRGQP